MSSKKENSNILSPFTTINNSVLEENFECSKENVISDVKGTVLQEFYRDTNIFITGATGFLGKVLVEKLLRACPNINRIYVLVRSKKGKSVEERVDDMVSVLLFDKLKVECPEFKSKLHPISGDITMMGLGIGDEDQRLLNEQVDVVFHVAATVRFDEKLSDAITKNVRGTREMLALSRFFVKLKSFVHVSTAYSNCHESCIEESFYTPPLDSDTAISMAETSDPELLESITKNLLGKWPNTYSFTKMLSEDIIKKHGQGLPIGVFRPAIVVCTSAEPAAGWIDNIRGPGAILLGVSNGLLRTCHVDVECETNLVPCDLVVNSLIASAWDIAENRLSDIPIYNFVVPKKNKFTWREYTKCCLSHRMDYPCSKAIWYPICLNTKHFILAQICRLFLHIIPAMIIDLVLVIARKELRLLPIYSKIHNGLDITKYFGFKSWDFKNDNVDQLWKKLDAADKEKFDFDIVHLNWEKFIDRTLLGMRWYYLKEGPETIDAAVVRMRRLRMLHRILVSSLLCLASWLCLKILNSAFSG